MKKDEIELEFELDSNDCQNEFVFNIQNEPAGKGSYGVMRKNHFSAGFAKIFATLRETEGNLIRRLSE